MNRRDRVLKAVNHEETDFIPYNFHAIPAVLKKVQQYYGLRDDHEVVEFIGNHIVKIGSDFNYNPWSSEVGKTKITLSGGPVYTEIDHKGYLHRDEFGCVWNRKGSMPYPVDYPLGEKLEIDNYHFPDPHREGRFDEARQIAERYYKKVFLFGKLGMCLFERAWSIRGMEKLLMDMYRRPEFVEKLLDRILYEWNLSIIDQQITLGVDGFYFGDDWGTKTGLMFSPAMWRRFIKPRLAIMFNRCKEAGLIVGLHSDGAVETLFPDLIEIGLQIFNPLSTTIMDPGVVKKKYGKKLTFYGGIDVEQLLPFGSPDDIRREIHRMIDIMGNGGGFILQSTHTILDDVPKKNIVAYIDEVRKLAGLN